MKKIIILFLSFLVFFFLSSKTSAQEVSPTSTPQVNYELPYPGLLPDNPLYFLRVIRDKIVSFIIADPLRKAEFNLLQADKRLNAGIYLFNKGKISQALSTTSKAENYFDQAISEIRKVNMQGMETKELIRKLLDSSKKHQETILSLEEKSKGNVKESLKRERERAEAFGKQVERLIRK